MAQKNNQPTGWIGWAAFASFMMILAGMFQVVVALTAILKDEFFVVTENYLFTINVQTWGWVHLILSVVVIMAGFAILSGKMWGRVIGVMLAGISAVANMAFIPYYPLWSLLIITVDVLVIYALIAHGSELAD